MPTPLELRLLVRLRALRFGKLLVTKRDGEIVFVEPMPGFKPEEV